MYILLVFLALGSVSTHDIIVGSSTGGKKVFDEHFQASPAVWRQTQNVTINTTDDEVISRIVVTDLREEKDGDAKIVDGGEGQKKVTIELKSPTVLRGYNFNVEVYAEPNKEFQGNPLKNGPHHPSEFKTNAANFNTPNPAGKATLTNLDATTKFPGTTETLTSQSEVKTPNKARETRDTEVKKPEENKPNIDSPSIFGHQKKASTTVKPKDSTVSVTVSSRSFGEEGEDEEKPSENVLRKDNKNNDEARRVRDTHDETITKNSPKFGSFDSKATTTTYKTPSYNVNKNNPASSHPVSVADDRETTATNKDESVSPTLVPSQRNPTVYTPNLDGNVPSLKDSVTGNDNKPINDNLNLSNQKRDARDTHDGAKEITPKVLADGLTEGVAKNVGNVTNNEERKARSAQNGPKISPINSDVKDIPSTTAMTFTDKKDDVELETGSDKALNPPVLTRTQNYPVPYPYETTTKITTTMKAQKRDTELSQSKDDKASLNSKLFGSQNATAHDHKTPVVSLQ